METKKFAAFSLAKKKHRSTLAFGSCIKKQVPAGEIHDTRATTDNITFWLANENQRRHSRNFIT